MKAFKQLSLMLLVAILVFYGWQSYERPVALVNGKIYQSGGISTATALVIENGVIRYIGSNDGARDNSRWDAKTVDVQGRLILPGFIDGHVHPMFGAMMDAACQLQEVTLPEQLRQVLEDCAAHSDDSILVGFGLNQSLVPMNQAMFGPNFDDQPVLIIAYDVHTAFLNQAGLNALNISASTPSPEAGLIEKDPSSGEPTGLLLDSALHEVLFTMGNPGLKESVTMLRAWIQKANQYGYTSMLDTGSAVEVGQFYGMLSGLGLLNARVHAAHVVTPQEPGAVQIEDLLGMGMPKQSDSHSINTIKLLLDGVIESNTGALEPGYGIENPPGAYFTQEHLTEIVTLADKHGIMVHMHATADLAINMAITAVEAARAQNSTSKLTHTIAHAEIPNPEVFSKLAALNMTVNVTPLWIAPPMETYETYRHYLGDERIDWLQPLQSLFSAGVTVSAGSDYPVTSNNPFLAIESAVTRKDPLGERNDVFQPEQRISVAQAIDMLTLHAAHQIGQQDVVGSLHVGKLADVIVLDQNILEIDVEAISDTTVNRVFLSGKQVYSRQD